MFDQLVDAIIWPSDVAVHAYAMLQLEAGAPGSRQRTSAS
jgi:hypothetical protein